MKYFSNILPFFIFLSVFFSCNQTKVNQPIQLQCEFRENPLGIDVNTPRLSWQLGDTVRGSRQTAYQIIVATDLKRLSADEADVWNSGKVDSGKSHLVDFSGPVLKSSTRYYWAVRIWNHQDKPSAFSSPAWWETGLLSNADWKAKWIGREVSNSEPENPGNWICSKASITPNKPV